jgi:Integrase core domain
VERFHKTLRDEFFSKHTFTTIEQAQQALDSFVEDYNALRPHQSLGERTPAERFRLRAVEAPQPVVQDPVETHEDAAAPVRPDGTCDRTATCGRSMATVGSSSPEPGTGLRGSSPASSSPSGSTETSFASSTATRSSKLSLRAIPWKRR